jgi:hypothetical protein
MISPRPASAPWLGRRNCGQLRWQAVRRVGRKTQLEEGHKRHLETGETAAAIDEDSHRHRLGSGGANQSEAFVDPAAARNDILHDEDPLARRKGKTPAEHENVALLLCEEKASAETARDLLTDDEPSHGWGQNRRELVQPVVPELRRQQLGQALHLRHVLAHLGALKEVATVQSRSQDEVPCEKGLGASEDVEYLAFKRRI